jgi:xylulose-5-phosphate/fructose-6-phosphate phosphoketolase
MDREDRTESGGQPLSRAQLELMDGWWRAANYLSVGQIYLLDNPLLERPLERADIKPRLLGHWRTTAGLNFVYVRLNRVIKARGLDMIYICGPGHGGPGMVANTWLEGSGCGRSGRYPRDRIYAPALNTEIKGSFARPAGPARPAADDRHVEL